MVALGDWPPRRSLLWSQETFLRQLAELRKEVKSAIFEKISDRHQEPYSQMADPVHQSQDAAIADAAIHDVLVKLRGKWESAAIGNPKKELPQEPAIASREVEEVVPETVHYFHGRYRQTGSNSRGAENTGTGGHPEGGGADGGGKRIPWLRR